MALTANQTYTVKMEFYENGGGAIARLHWSTATIADVAVPFVGGATGNYYNDSAAGHLTGTPVLKRVDRIVDSNTIWTNGDPAPGVVGGTNFSAMWTGKVQPQFSEIYTFHTVSDDGVRLYVNGTLIINNWTDHGQTDDFGNITLSAGQKYNIEMDFYQGGGGDIAQLLWSSPSTADTIIPKTQLYSGVAPAAPTNLTAAAASGTEIDLKWQDNSNIETGYSVEQSTDGTNFTSIVTLPANTTTYNSTALNPNTTYWYRVQAMNFAANSAYSNTVSLLTPVPPNKPTNAHPTTVTTTTIGMAWTDNANNEDGYRISRSKNGDPFIVIAQLPPDSSSYLDNPSPSGLVPGTQYDYHIQAFNVAGFNDFSGFKTETITLAPTGLNATAHNGSIDLAWTAPSFASANPSDLSFSVYRGTTPGGESATAIATGLSSPVFTDTGLTNGVTYYYKVTAVDLGGESAKSGETSATPASAVADHKLFYNHSYWDDPANGFSNDDSAIDTSKVALLGGQTATFANYSGSSLGINGIMVDIAGLPTLLSASLNINDFSFKIGNDNNPSAWAIAPNPTISVRRGAGTGGSDRVELIWADNAIQDTWLQVTVKADGLTGLSSPHVFYYGNQIGETGNDPTNTFVDGGDFVAVRDHPANFLNRAQPSNPYDFNHDSFVDGADLGSRVTIPITS